MKFYVYILSNKRNNVLYAGMTDNICRRVLEHKLKVYEGFTSKYNVDKLVYYEIYDSSEIAANREKQFESGITGKEDKLD